MVKYSYRRINMNLKDNEEQDLDDLVIDIVDDDVAQEGLGKLITFGTLLFLLGTSGVVQVPELKRNLESEVKSKQVQSGKVTLTKKEIGNVVKKSQAKDAKEMVGSWEKAKAINIVARTLYMEDRSEGEPGLKRIMTVIWNRAGGDKTKLVDKCLARKQFSCWNKIDKKEPNTYVIEFPSEVVDNQIERRAWVKCVEIAKSAFDGTFVPDEEVGNRNIYANPKDCQAAKDSWGQLCDLQLGKHKFGYAKDQDGFRKAGTPTPPKVEIHVVKDGETLWSISGKSMAKVKKLKELNGLKSDIIKPGQTLKLV